jgi:hypothetical protein
VLGNFTKNSFPSSDSRSARVLDSIHVDFTVSYGSCISLNFLLPIT